MKTFILHTQVILFTVSTVHFPVVNFRLVYPDRISEDIGSLDVCIEQMNGELSEEVQVTVKISQTASTATGILYIILKAAFLVGHNIESIQSNLLCI